MNSADHTAPRGRTKKRPSPLQVERALESIGSSLEAWRKLRGLTQAQVASRAGLNRDTIVRLEKGDGGVSLENVLLVLRALGLRISCRSLWIRTNPTSGDCAPANGFPNASVPAASTAAMPEHVEVIVESAANPSKRVGSGRTGEARASRRPSAICRTISPDASVRARSSSFRSSRGSSKRPSAGRCSGPSPTALPTVGVGELINRAEAQAEGLASTASPRSTPCLVFATTFARARLASVTPKPVRSSRTATEGFRICRPRPAPRRCGAPRAQRGNDGRSAGSPPRG